MYVQVRNSDGKTVTVTISKLTTVRDFKRIVEASFNVKPETQILLYKGKQLEECYNLFAYDVRLNDVIQLMIKVSGNEVPLKPPKNYEVNAPSSSVIGNLVDAVDPMYGSCLEAGIVDIKEGGTNGNAEDTSKTSCSPLAEPSSAETSVAEHETTSQNDPGIANAVKNAPTCSFCKDNPCSTCKQCSCRVCGGKHDPKQQLLCDECNMAYHMGCLKPPLTSLPEEEEWYCPECKTDMNEIVLAGAKLKDSKKKLKNASNTTRDWGKGFACVGRVKECTLVPQIHHGPIPGIEVGMSWKLRIQVSESGVHRPPVAGIHGREANGAFSLVLSGGYEDDVDNGDEFLYTGSGGRDLSGNKRTAVQSCDQVLTRMNKALALNCNVRLDKNGAEAKDWKGGKPVRVVRNYKLSKHSKYAPEEGNRYDGLYKVVKYYKQKGKSGFSVWRYVLRRDDPTPAPWTEEGKKHMENLGLEMQYPEGYLVAKSGGGEEGNKRKLQESDLQESKEPTSKKKKVMGYELEAVIKKLIGEDIKNKKEWDECTNTLEQGKQKYLAKVAESFMCICCQELTQQPITTDCGHNMCKVCLRRSFQAEVYTCPHCRYELGSKYEMNVNTVLATILTKLFPGYEKNR